jgi:hypothetical protein
MPHFLGPDDVYEEIPIYNDSGETIPAFGVVAISDTYPDAGITYKKAVKPSTTWYNEWLLNGPSDVPAGDKGVAYRGPRALCKTSPTNGQGFGPKPGQWELELGYPTIFLASGLHLSSGSVYVGFGEWRWITRIIGKLAEACSQGEAAVDVDVWGSTAGSEVDTTFNLVASDWLMKSGATDIASGKKVVCELINGIWYITEAECA